jgi:hypothetical protein
VCRFSPPNGTRLLYSPIAAADFSCFSMFQRTVLNLRFASICEGPVPAVDGIYDRHSPQDRCCGSVQRDYVEHRLAQTMLD